MLKKLKLSEEDKADIYFAKKIISWLDYRKAGMMEHLYFICVLFEEIAKLYSIDYDLLSYYSPEEIIELIKKGKKTNKKILQKRRGGAFVVFEKNGKRKYFFGDEGKKIFDIVLCADKQEFLKGAIACRGKNKKVSGKIKIITNPKKEVFNDGEILATSMTRVEFLPFMRKAKAIITNEGGIACHAAIVSRELGIPCIIGTKTATRILKDGDIVEMDMNNGEIKILSQ